MIKDPCLSCFLMLRARRDICLYYFSVPANIKSKLFLTNIAASSIYRSSKIFMYKRKGSPNPESHKEKVVKRNINVCQ